MSYYLIGFALIVAAGDWVAVAKKWKILEYFAKPGVILILIAWLFINGGYQGPAKFFMIGLFFSLAVDIFLMLPDEKFIAGLVSFLIAHLAYIRGFTISGLHFSTAGFGIIVLVGLIGFVMNSPNWLTPLLLLRMTRGCIRPLSVILISCCK